MIALPSPGCSAMGVAEPVFKTCGSAYTIQLVEQLCSREKVIPLSLTKLLSTGSRVYCASNFSGCKAEQDDNHKRQCHHSNFLNMYVTEQLSR